MNRLLALLLLLSVLPGCSQGVQRDFGFVPHCLSERVWDHGKGVVVTRPVCTEPAFYRHFRKTKP